MTEEIIIDFEDIKRRGRGYDLIGDYSKLEKWLEENCRKHHVETGKNERIGIYSFGGENASLKKDPTITATYCNHTPLNDPDPSSPPFTLITCWDMDIPENVVKELRLNSLDKLR
ncbi:hypothetical protein HY449_00115 [Candidatus Pacearchaeota archaeon]|nr:hypothetical protein [Candidatus Pacearchaeota archaeon]